jgi:hypothetical protein
MLNSFPTENKYLGYFVLWEYKLLKEWRTTKKNK